MPKSLWKKLYWLKNYIGEAGYNKAYLKKTPKKLQLGTTETLKLFIPIL